jgi:hypothetical protein
MYNALADVCSGLPYFETGGIGRGKTMELSCGYLKTLKCYKTNGVLL